MGYTVDVHKNNAIDAGISEKHMQVDELLKLYTSLKEYFGPGGDAWGEDVLMRGDVHFYPVRIITGGGAGSQSQFSDAKTLAENELGARPIPNEDGVMEVKFPKPHAGGRKTRRRKAKRTTTRRKKIKIFRNKRKTNRGRRPTRR